VLLSEFFVVGCKEFWIEELEVVMEVLEPSGASVEVLEAFLLLAVEGSAWSPEQM